jgi:hypothetical protein
MKGIILETYPSIGRIIANEPIIAFDKLDGSNIRAEWNRKNGFTKFGTRTRLLDPNEKTFGEAIEIFNESHADILSEIFSKAKLQRATAFLEFYGQNSFAGFHDDNEPHKVSLFDIHVYKTGMLTAREFLKLVGDKVETPEILFQGKVNSNFIEKVKNSSLEGMTFEGVVCKGGLDNRRRPIMFKVKSQAWLDKLKNKYIDNLAMYEKLK